MFQCNFLDELGVDNFFRWRWSKHRDRAGVRTEIELHAEKANYLKFVHMRK